MDIIPDVVLTCTKCELKTTSIETIMSHLPCKGQTSYSSLEAKITALVEKYNELEKKVQHLESLGNSEDTKRPAYKFKSASVGLKVENDLKLKEDLTDDIIVLDEEIDITTDFSFLLPILETALSEGKPKFLLDNRSKLLASSILTDYTKLLREHTAKVEESLKSRNPTQKVSKIAIGKYLTPLDMRLVKFKYYTKSHLDQESITLYRTSLQLGIPQLQTFTPLQSKPFLEIFHTYAPAILSLKDVVLIQVQKWKLFPPIAYFPLEKSSDSDPYSFYYLDTVEENKRCWIMDCRLETFSTKFLDNMRAGLTKLFRDIYRDVFGDNTYRADYVTKSPVLEYDCAQIFANLLWLPGIKETCDFFREIIKSHLTYRPDNKIDKVNIFSDDVIQKKRFASLKSGDLTEVVKSLFDGLTYEEAVEVKRSLHV